MKSGPSVDVCAAHKKKKKNRTRKEPTSRWWWLRRLWTLVLFYSESLRRSQVSFLPDLKSRRQAVQRRKGPPSFFVFPTHTHTHKLKEHTQTWGCAAYLREWLTRSLFDNGQRLPSLKLHFPLVQETRRTKIRKKKRSLDEFILSASSFLRASTKTEPSSEAL